MYLEKGIVVKRDGKGLVVEVNGITKIVNCSDLSIEEGQEVKVFRNLAFK